MNCEQMKLLMSLWLDGEATAQEQALLQEHLERCSECRALLEQLQTLHTSFSDLEEIPAPEGFAQGVMDRIAAGEKPRAKVIPLFKRPQMRAVAGLAACAVLCIGFARLVPDMNKSASAPAPEAAFAPAAVVAAAPEGAAEHYFTAKQAEPEVAMDAAPEESACGVAEAPDLSAEWVQPQAAPECKGEEPANLIVLNALPEGAQEELGTLEWQTRETDGALWAEVSAQQVQTILELSAAQGLSVEQQISEQGENPRWIVVLNG